MHPLPPVSLQRSFRRLLVTCTLIMTVLMMMAIAAAPLLPHEGQIVYNARERNTQALYLFDTGRALHHPLVRQPADSYLPSWSDDGAQLAYVAPPSAEHEAQTIARIYPARNLIEPLYRPQPQPGVIRSEAIWSPDARDLVFTYAHTPGDAPGSGGIQLVQLDLGSGAVASMPLSPEFAPVATSYQRIDDRWLRSITISERFAVLRDFDMHTLELASDRLQIWELEFVSLLPPAISPNGQQFIVPAVSTAMRSFDLYLFTVGQETGINLTENVRSNETQPTWSPDGTQIAYKMLSGAGQALVVAKIETMDARIVFQHSTARITDLRWSTDGRRIAFLVTLPGMHEMCIADLSSGTIDCPVIAERIAEAVWRPSS